MSLSRPTCAHCAYWVAETSATGLAKLGYCHRRPPSVAYNSKSEAMSQKFPITERNEWCGEWDGDDSRLVEAKRELVRGLARA